MKISAGILLYKFYQNELLFFLVHPGGPFFVRKNNGWWTIPKGELMEGEHALDCAVREFEEETGYKPEGTFTELGEIMQKGGKAVRAWLCEGDLDPSAIESDTFELEWPPRSGIKQAFPEIDKAGWFTYKQSLELINERQRRFITDAAKMLIG